MTPAGSSTSTTAPAGAPSADVDRTLTDRMKAAVERLEGLAAEILAKLDALEGDPDLEPVLGAPEVVAGLASAAFRAQVDQTGWASTGDVDEREPIGDDEPSLGSLCGCWTALSQERWSDGANGDEEEGHDGREPSSGEAYQETRIGGRLIDMEDNDKSDAECSLGWAETVDQSRLGSATDEIEYSLGAPNPTAYTDQTHWGERNEGWGGGEAEEQCEDEGAQCDDEGSDSDTEMGADAEPDQHDQVPNYEDHHSQLRPGYHGVY
jgi:hypothetical protein